MRKIPKIEWLAKLMSQTEKSRVYTQYPWVYYLRNRFIFWQNQLGKRIAALLALAIAEHRSQKSVKNV